MALWICILFFWVAMMQKLSKTKTPPGPKPKYKECWVVGILKTAPKQTTPAGYQGGC
jgi:hypothetical protein